MARYKVDSGNKMPEIVTMWVYPWHEMAVGDSFDVPEEEGALVRVRSAVGYTNGRQAPKRWKAYPVAGGVIRVWRVK